MTASDLQGRSSLAGQLGIQVFDPTGWLFGVISRPQHQKPLTSCALSGQRLQSLNTANGDKVFWREARAKGCLPHLGPVPVPGR